MSRTLSCWKIERHNQQRCVQLSWTLCCGPLSHACGSAVVVFLRECRSEVVSKAMKGITAWYKEQNSELIKALNFNPDTRHESVSSLLLGVPRSQCVRTKTRQQTNQQVRHKSTATFAGSRATQTLVKCTSTEAVHCQYKVHHKDSRTI